MPPRLLKSFSPNAEARWNQAILSVCGCNFHFFCGRPASGPVTRYRFRPCTFWTFVLLTLTKPCANYVSMSMETLTRAWEVLQDAYQAQMEGDYDRAVELYQSSLELHPTAEAHTFLGWTYHYQGRIEDAIAECKRAIELDPEFGNPYNDIGAYLIELGRFEEAIEIEPRYSLAKQALDSLRRMVN